MKAMDMIRLKAVDLERTVDRLEAKRELEQAARDLEAIAKTAALYAGYCRARQAGKPHEEAVNDGQRAAAQVWCQVFGYNGYHKFTF